MGQIKLSDGDIDFLKKEYPGLTYNETDNEICGEFNFHRSYNGDKIKGRYSIEFRLENGEDSILPIVRETKGKILSIAKRKKIPIADVHLNDENGELCLIFPAKEKEFYPKGFEFERFMNHIETHLYWVTYFDRYNKRPWEDEPHGKEEALIKAVKKNRIYRKDLRVFLETKENRKLSRPEFRRYLKANNLL